MHQNEQVGRFLPFYVNNSDIASPFGEVVHMNTSMQQSQADILSRLYDMKCKQVEHAQQQGNSLRCQVLQAEAEAISNALKSVR